MANTLKYEYNDYIDDTGEVLPLDDDPSGRSARGAGEVLDARYIPKLDISGDHEGYDAEATFRLPNFVGERTNNGDGYSDSELDPHYGKGGATPNLSKKQSELNLSEIDKIRAEIAKLSENEK